MLKFDEDGKRKEFILDIIELSKTGFKRIGFWDAMKGVNYTRTSEEVFDILAEKWQNKTFIVTSRLGAPFLQNRESKNGELLVGNNRFEGYSLDLIDGISKILNFTYVFELAPDGKYGSYDKVTKKWDGLVRELLDRVGILINFSFTNQYIISSLLPSATYKDYKYIMFHYISESRPCHLRSDNHLRPTNSRRLHDALHDLGNQYLVR